jgi:hypothetical protein
VINTEQLKIVRCEIYINRLNQFGVCVYHSFRSKDENRPIGLKKSKGMKKKRKGEIPTRILNEDKRERINKVVTVLGH